MYWLTYTIRITQTKQNADDFSQIILWIIDK